MFQNVNFTVEIFYSENVFAKGHVILKGHGISKAGKINEIKQMETSWKISVHQLN